MDENLPSGVQTEKARKLVKKLKVSVFGIWKRTMFHIGVGNQYRNTYE